MTIISAALVLDRQLLCRAGLAAIVQHRFPCCDVELSADLDHARAWIGARSRPVLLIVDGDIDLGRPDVGGIRGLRSRYPLLSLAVMDWRRDQRVALRAIGEGAIGYIPKDLEQDEMLQAFDLVMSGQVYIPSDVGDFEQDIVPGEAEEGSLNALTGRQREVLTHMSMGKSNKEIGRSLRISESTVKVHVAAAFRQLGVHNRVGAVAMLQRRSA
ncbi:response regulator transcription factor [Sphingopyxis sp. J-6]|uniref:LuxR C-terminal-related transcriptional regulator n=1 Tax=Sphingopyxis sp. J-6 TaxID=3122054 RepID=UPI003983F465